MERICVLHADISFNKPGLNTINGNMIVLFYTVQFICEQQICELRLPIGLEPVIRSLQVKVIEIYFSELV